MLAFVTPKRHTEAGCCLCNALILKERTDSGASPTPSATTLFPGAQTACGLNFSGDGNGSRARRRRCPRGKLTGFLKPAWPLRGANACAGR